MPPKKLAGVKVRLADSTLEYNGIKIFLMIPPQLEAAEKKIIAKFKQDMGLMIKRTNSVLVSDLYKESLKIREKMENQEPIAN